MRQAPAGSNERGESNERITQHSLELSAGDLAVAARCISNSAKAILQTLETDRDLSTEKLLSGLMTVARLENLANKINTNLAAAETIHRAAVASSGGR